MTLLVLGVVALGVSLWQRQASVDAAEDLWPRAEKALKEQEAWSRAQYAQDYGEERRANNIRPYVDAKNAVRTWDFAVAGSAGAVVLGGVLLWLGRANRPTAADAAQE
jgi:hypothetical protein